MELSQITNSINTINEANSFKVDNIETKPNIKSVQVDKVDISNEGVSSFTSKLTSNINNIANLQKLELVVSRQSDTLSGINKLANQIVDKKTNNSLDLPQQLQSLITSYNNDSTTIESSDLINTNRSTAYFDGKLGFEPLSGEEIINKVSIQKNRLAQVQQNIKDNTSEYITASKAEISTIREQIEVKAEIKNIDFKVESSYFTKDSMKNFQGSIDATQANANKEQNINLLVS
ncbi:MAG: hypothetical protein U9R37_01645 [Campylobacterota bacterium]|nr:hypothetical protein [Campylobacterota bacterium]